MTFLSVSILTFIADASGYSGYWTSSAVAGDSYDAWHVCYFGDLSNYYVGFDNLGGINNIRNGVRPVITIDKDLVPASVPMVADENATYEIPTGTATDNCSTPASVTTSGSVNTSVLGSYPINYSTTDEAGNSKTLTMTVNVVDKTAPKIRFNPEPNNEWKNNIQVIVTAIDDIEVGSLLWCQTTGNNSSCTPTTVGTANGTTIDIDTEDDYHVICVQATDTSGNITTKCSNETGNYYKLDKTAPVLTVDGHTSDYSVTPNTTQGEASGTMVFDYSGDVQTFTAPVTGDYKLQVWGAQGGYRSNSAYAGKGGYSEGTVYLTEGTELYIYVGGSGNTGGTAGGFNGGGARNTYNGGGGATDIRIGQDSLYARVIVAGGGGSDGRNAAGGTGGYGGGLQGEATTSKSSAYGSGGYAGTQTGVSNASWQVATKPTSTTTQAGAYAGFGFGGNGILRSSGYGGAGGGGWYGGAGIYPDSSGDDDRGGAGGSGYIYTADTAANYPSGCLLNSSYYLTDAQTIAGNTSFESPTGGTETGHTGDGYAIISYTGIGTVLDFEIPEGTATDNFDNDVEVIRNIPGAYPHPGKNRITYTATDDAGNIKTLTLTVNTPDSTPPKIVFNPETDNAWHNTNYQVNVSATDDSYGIGSLLWCQTTGENATCTPTTVGDPTGTTIDIDTDSKYHVICVQASDESNNITTQCSNAEGNYYVLDKTAPVLIVDGHTSDYSVNFTPEEFMVYENGTPVYFNPVSGQICEDYVAANSLNNNKTGCMRWYIFNDDGKSTVDMILDHNTTKTVQWHTSADNSTGPSTILTQLHTDTDGWTGVPARTDTYTDPLKGYEINYSGYRARLIEANEIAKITGADKALQWDSGKPYVHTPTIGTHSSWFYLDGKYGTDSKWQTRVASGQGTSKYAWLYDYTEDCTSYGCNIADDSGYTGYWTSSASANNSNNHHRAWYVAFYGDLGYGVYGYDLGVRPVITIDRSLIPDDTPMVPGLSIFEVPEATATDNFDNDVDITVTGAENASNSGTNNVVYKATDDAGNVKTLTLTVNVTDKVLPSISFEPEAEDEWTNSNYQVKVSATDDLAVGSLLWCQTTGKDATCTPTTVGSPSGTMVDINTENEYHVICAQASDTTGNLVTKCSNDGGKYYKLDKTAPSLSVDGKTSDFSITPSILSVSVSEQIFNYTGSEQTLTVPTAGQYEIDIAGAEGSVGNTYGQTTTLTGGKGANLKASFELNAGDILHVVVGGQGTATSNTSSDGTSGGGGGGTFIFKEIDTITDSNYQFTKNGQNYEVLLVAAGGGGTGDIGYSSSYRTTGGEDGVGDTWYSPDNMTAYSTQTVNGTSNTNLTKVLGISQYISYNLVGGYYKMGSGVCQGGYGGGGCADDQRTYGGGWSGSSYKAYSFSSGTDTTGTTGANTGNGYAKITYTKVVGDLSVGNEVYFNPVTGSSCSDYVAANSLNENNTRCMRWYVLNKNEDGTLDLLLDHNTTYKSAWSSGSTPNEVLTALQDDTSGWDGVPTRTDSYTDSVGGYTTSYNGYKARLVTKDEVSSIQPWMINYTNGCTSDGCETADSNTSGYWTISYESDEPADNAWAIYGGNLVSHRAATATNVGVRPVITVSASEFPANLPTGVATDNYDDDVEITTTGSVDYGTPGSYPVTYTATDDAGNSTSIVVTVLITQDKIAPTIVVNGKSTSHSMDVRLNDTTFVVPTATVTDNSGENLTVTTSGDVTVSVEGTYNVTYTATDSAGNTTNLVLTVNVAPVRANQLEYTNTTNTSCSQAQCVIDELFSLLQ